MSSLKWQTAVWFRALQAGDRYEVKECGWELVNVQPPNVLFDPYYIPIAEVRKIKDRCWRLDMRDEVQSRFFKTLKEAKAMGIALYRMDNDE